VGVGRIASQIHENTIGQPDAVWFESLCSIFCPNSRVKRADKTDMRFILQSGELMMAYTIFVSHTRQDKKIAEQIKKIINDRFSGHIH